jgi:hypothetical protein
MGLREIYSWRQWSRTRGRRSAWSMMSRSVEPNEKAASRQQASALRAEEDDPATSLRRRAHGMGGSRWMAVKSNGVRGRGVVGSECSVDEAWYHKSGLGPSGDGTVFAGCGERYSGSG